jgi:fumarate hydratase class II
MPMAVIRSMAIIKKSAAQVNACHFGLDKSKAEAISQAADEVS